jgi:hypothetical protein
MSGKAKKLRDEYQLGISYLVLRRVVGCIGILLPLGLFAGNRIATGILPGSMSAYYYTDMRNLFVGALCVLGVFLIAYAGFDAWDRALTNVAGGGAILVAFLPTKPAVCGPQAGQCLAPAVPALSAEQTWVGNFHLVFAAVTFIALGCMALRFAKTEPAAYERPAAGPAAVSVLRQVRNGLGFDRPLADTRTVQKKKRNLVYRISGVAIFVCIGLAVASSFFPQPIHSYLPWLFIFEALADIAFGISWLVKGDTFLKDVRARSGGGSVSRETQSMPVLQRS